jgi:putative ABC transport system ATP-binding protein
MIQLTNVSKHYGDNGAVQALHNLSLTVEQGERVAVMGPSGSGKSTLLNLICGLDEPTSGSIKLEGIELAALDDDRRTRLRREKLGMIFQTFNLLPTLTALENAALPLRLQGMRRRESEERAAAMLERVGLKIRAHHRPDELSGGERQRVAIARALVGEPSLLLADEPTGNLDSATGEEIMRLFGELNARGHTIVLVTHEPRLAARCPRAIRLSDGKVVAEGPGREVAALGGVEVARA